MDQADLDLGMIQFRIALQNLSATADLQCQLFPEAIPTTDELLLDHGHWSEWYLRTMQPTTLQRHAVDVLESAIQSVQLLRSSDGFEWTEDGLRTLPAWEKIRRAAREVLATLDGPSSETNVSSS